MEDAAIGWGTPSAGSKPLISNIELTIKRGQRILVLGPNGAGKKGEHCGTDSTLATNSGIVESKRLLLKGKSTLIKAIGGNLELWGGKKKYGDGVKISYFSQDLAQVSTQSNSATAAALCVHHDHLLVSGLLSHLIDNNGVLIQSIAHAGPAS